MANHADAPELTPEEAAWNAEKLRQLKGQPAYHAMLKDSRAVAMEASGNFHDLPTLMSEYDVWFPTPRRPLGWRGNPPSLEVIDLESLLAYFALEQRAATVVRHWQGIDSGDLLSDVCHNGYSALREWGHPLPAEDLPLGGNGRKFSSFDEAQRFFDRLKRHVEALNDRLQPTNSELGDVTAAKKPHVKGNLFEPRAPAVAVFQLRNHWADADFSSDGSEPDTRELAIGHPVYEAVIGAFVHLGWHDGRDGGYMLPAEAQKAWWKLLRQTKPSIRDFDEVREAAEAVATVIENAASGPNVTSPKAELPPRPRCERDQLLHRLADSLNAAAAAWWEPWKSLVEALHSVAPFQEGIVPPLIPEGIDDRQRWLDNMMSLGVAVTQCGLAEFVADKVKSDRKPLDPAVSPTACFWWMVQAATAGSRTELAAFAAEAWAVKRASAEPLDQERWQSIVSERLLAAWRESNTPQGRELLRRMTPFRLALLGY
jgi:hypothetical protein